MSRGVNSVTDVFLARQPILDRQLRVAAYELLYRSGDVEHALVGGENHDHEGATATVAINALTEVGLERLVGEHQAWLNVSRAFVLDGLAMSLPRGRMVLELLEDQYVDDRLVAALSDLRAAGFALALDDFTYTPAIERLLGLVDIVKLDLVALGRDGLAQEAKRLAPYGLTLVGEKVETEDDFQFCAEAGCELFQGYFFCKPQLIRRRAIAPNRIALVQLAAALQDPALELAELERLISRDIALSYRLLRFINSAYFSLPHEIASIGHALALLGLENVRHWSTLTVLGAIDDKPRELMMTALIRARFCQQAVTDPASSSAERFTVGLFSVLDALMDTTMEQALAMLPFPQAMRDALTWHRGPNGRWLECVQAIEHGEFDRAARLVRDAGSVYLSSLAWANSTARALVAPVRAA